MPYPHAWIWIIGLMLMTLPAFWPFYFARLTESSWQFHWHAVTASLWMLLLAWQNRSIHKGQRQSHRSVGRAMFILVPLFVAGGLLIIDSMAGKSNLFYDMYGHRLAALDFVAIGAFTFFVHEALRHRRKVGLHAGYMLATVFMLVTPILARFLQLVPMLSIRSAEELPRFGLSLQISQAVAIAAALWLWRRQPRIGKPFAITAGLLLLQSLLFETIGHVEAWRSFTAAFAAIGPGTHATSGFIIGAVAVFSGWRLGGGRPAVPQAA